MKIAKADKKDFDVVLKFLLAAEEVLERQKFSLHDATENYLDWDEDEPDRILIEKYIKLIAKQEGVSEKNVDLRLVMYEFLEEKFKPAGSAWRRVYYAASALIDAVCDPTEDHLAYHPGFEFLHVAPEQ